MPKFVEPIEISSKEELKARLPELLDIQRQDSIVGVRGLRLTEQEQLQLVRDLGDIVGWYPNNSENFSHKYVENHASNPDLTGSTGDDVVLNWHLERIDYDQYIPLVGGVWNMRKFECDKESGKTYFIDSRKIYQAIFSADEQEFLRKVVASYEDINSITSEAMTNYVKVVQNHWLTGEEQIRIELYKIKDSEVYSISGENPSTDDSILFKNLMLKFEREVFFNEDLRIVHKWEEGDILIPDLFSLAHAVTGGFDPKDREFTGYWCYLSSPDTVGPDKVHPSWEK